MASASDSRAGVMRIVEKGGGNEMNGSLVDALKRLACRPELAISNVCIKNEGYSYRRISERSYL